MSRQSGDPLHLFLSEQSTQAEWEAWGVELGLDKPLWQQYVIWLGNAVTGDFGESIRQRKPSLDVVIERIPATLELALGSFLFSVVTGIPLGVLSALKRSSIWDYIWENLCPRWAGRTRLLARHCPRAHIQRQSRLVARSQTRRMGALHPAFRDPRLAIRIQFPQAHPISDARSHGL